ncbi:hypothetical protein H0H87_011123, partial [Tephrocybe sp. NHM501043]
MPATPCCSTISGPLPADVWHIGGRSCISSPLTAVTTVGSVSETGASADSFASVLGAGPSTQAGTEGGGGTFFLTRELEDILAKYGRDLLHGLGMPGAATSLLWFGSGLMELLGIQPSSNILPAASGIPRSSECESVPGHPSALPGLAAKHPVDA